ncbi:unnamed protein product [Somion occarium]|uniref:Uncharacterized protein n=2 Tax=Somion occarium TaxID=3059160 RepID=A0ABP1DWH1_9APHY
MHRRWIFLILLCLIFYVSAQDVNISDQVSNTSLYENDDRSYSVDPILRYRPSFASSLPIQILVTGIVLTLTAVLFIHLIFTAQYHWPLAPVNFALQISAVFTLLIAHIATLQVILMTATRESRGWPYMLTYIAVDIPPLEEMDEWSTGELAAWLLMNATTSALIQITHIQFLTLLFPSSLERRLIFTLLGPLAVVASVMQLLPLHDSSNTRLSSISSAVQNICNATLSLLFTAALFIWGLFVNRKQAWRTDGGTAAFGAGALTLALASTAITFIYIPSKDQYVWMPGLMWAVILWQSFLGWWWWVGAGMGVGEVEEILRREEKRRRKRRARLAKRRERKEKVDTFWKGVAGALGYDRKARMAALEVEGNTSDEGHVHSGEGNSQPGPRSRNRRPSQESTSGSTLASVQSKGIPRIFNTSVGRVLHSWYALLRHAHLTAAREQAVEHVERIQQVYGREADIQPAGGEPPVVGWGLGSYGIRQAGADLRDGVSMSDIEEGDTLRDECAHRRENEDVEVRENENPSSHRRRRRTSGKEVEEEPEIDPPAREGHRPTSMWWWGPLQRWRLQDSTVYS